LGGSGVTAAVAHKLGRRFIHVDVGINSIQQAGYIKGDIISSKTTIIYVYVMYLIGKEEFKMDLFELRRLISRWFFIRIKLISRYLLPQTDEFIHQVRMLLTPFQDLLFFVIIALSGKITGNQSVRNILLIFCISYDNNFVFNCIWNLHDFYYHGLW
jgi:hypothetical protein